MPFHGSKLFVVALTIALLLLPSASATPISIEQTMSTRMSIRSWTSANISQQQLLGMLRDAYGYWNDHRSVPKVGADYSLVLFVANSTGTYLYYPETSTLAIKDLSVNKESLRPRFYQSYPSDASSVVIVVWNQTEQSNVLFASAEAGCLVQDLYLSAASSSLGTVCVSRIDSAGLRGDLSLPSTMIPLLVMPIGYLTTPYGSATPDYTRMTANLPPVQLSNRSFSDALSNLIYTQTWGTQDLSLQELSQLLWAAYGYSSTGHRTTPSAGPAYPLKIYVSNATGVYLYTPENHSVTQTISGDRRTVIASASGGQTWAANAPVIFLIVYDSTLGIDDGVVVHEYPEADTGCVVQSLLLEASAWNLSGNIVCKGLEDWNGAGAGTIRTILGLPSSLIPLYLVPVGHDGVVPEFSPSLILPVFIILTLIVVTLYKMQPWTSTKRREF